MLCQMKMKSRTGDGSLSRKRKERAVRPALPLHRSMRGCLNAARERERINE